MPPARVWMAALALGLTYWAVATSGPRAVGLWQDDAVYLATARSLAEGRGYRHPEIPGEPLQTKYPIGFPALLAPAFALGPDYPADLPLLLAPGAFLAGAFVALSALYLRRVFGEATAWVLTVAGLSALSPEIVSLVRFAMSDLPYAFWSVAALLCIDSAPESGRSARVARMLAGGALVGAAVLTRSGGLALALAAPLTQLLRRRPGDAACLIAATAVVVVPWWLWQANAAAANGALQTSPFTAYDLRYGSWLASEPGVALRVVQQNLFRSLFGLGFFQLALPADWSIEALRGGGARSLALHGLCYAAAALVLVGFVDRLRGGVRTLHVYALLYGGAILVWPFEPYRFLVCWTPFLLDFLLRGVRRVGSRLARRLPGTPRGAADAPAILLCVLLLTGFAAEDARIVASTTQRYYLMRAHRDLGEHAELVAWLREHTRDGDVVASNDTADLFLATGRQLRDTQPGVDPVSLFYGPDRRWSDLYALPADSETRRLVELSRPHLRDLFAGGGVAFYVEHGSDRATNAMRELRRQRPGAFEEVFATSRAGYRVYRVRPWER